MYKNSRGFTLVELIMVITLLGVIFAIGASYINIQGNTNRSEGNCLRTSLQNIEIVLTNYQQSKGHWPDADNTTCPTYPVDFKETCMPDVIPSYMVASPLTSSCCNWPYSYYLYTKGLGKIYLCIKATDLDKEHWEALKYILAKADEGKAYINTTCGATDNLADPLPDSPPAGTVYLTWWVVK